MIKMKYFVLFTVFVTSFVYSAKLFDITSMNISTVRDVFVRDKPSIRSKNLFSIPNGERFKVLKEKKSNRGFLWQFIIYRNKKGWISGSGNIPILLFGKLHLGMDSKQIKSQYSSFEYPKYDDNKKLEIQFMGKKRMAWLYFNKAKLLLIIQIYIVDDEYFMLHPDNMNHTEKQRESAKKLLRNNIEIEYRRMKHQMTILFKSKGYEEINKKEVYGYPGVTADRYDRVNWRYKNYSFTLKKSESFHSESFNFRVTLTISESYM